MLKAEIKLIEHKILFENLMEIVHFRDGLV
jgi:hypothetical protein